LKLLQIENLSTTLSSAGSEVPAVKGIDLDIHQGETLCLVGESGSGKSVTALSIMRLLPEAIVSHPTGRVLLRAGGDNNPTTDLLALDDATMASLRGSHMAMIFQEPMSSLNPVFTVGEQIVEAIEFTNPGIAFTEAEAIAIEALRDVKLKDPEARFREYPHKLAYTQQLLAAVPENLARRDSAPVVDDTLMTVENLSVHFPVRRGLLKRVVSTIKAVDDVSLSIRQGEILALVGESGSGKSTLGKALVRLLKPIQGRILYRDNDIGSLDSTAMRALRTDLQIVFQDPLSSLNPRLTIASALTEPMAAHKIGASHSEREAMAARLLQDVHLPADYLWRYPHEMSGGQRQRVGIARALAVNPRLIVCDEVTSALDVSVQAELLALLLELRERLGLTLLFITHNISVVEYISDRTAVMYNGRVVEMGDTAEVCGNPQMEYTQNLLASVPRLSTVQGN